MRDGVLVRFRDHAGDLVHQRLRVLDFDDPANNHFLCVRELWVPGGAVAVLRARGGGLTTTAEFTARSQWSASRGFGSRSTRGHFNALASAASVRSTSTSVL